MRGVSARGLLRAALVAVLGTACTSQLVMVAPRPPERYEKLGPAYGRACGTLFIDGTVYNFIPILLNSRVERAYNKAVRSVPGATALVNVRLEEFWVAYYIGTTRCVTITGDAIR